MGDIINTEDDTEVDYFKEKKEDPQLYYKYRYKIDSEMNQVFKWSPWTKMKLHEFVSEMQRKGIKIGVFDTHSKRMSSLPDWNDVYE